MGVSTEAPRCVWDAKAELGEGPVWLAEEGALYWVDIRGPAVHRYTPATGEQRTWPMPRTLGCLVPRTRGGFVAGFHDGLAFVELETGVIRDLLDPEPELPGNRINDGKADHQGRLWVGTMDVAEQGLGGALHRVDPDGACQVMDPDYRITNGPAFSVDGAVMYHTDSVERTIYRFVVAADGGLSGKQTFITIPAEAGYPDGMTVDIEDHLWVAHFAGARISRFDPSGSLVGEIPIPAPNVTSCAFGGPELRTLYVTTAAKGLDAEARAAAPLAGGLFEIPMDVAGLPAHRFGG